MRSITAILNVSLDGVIQAPGRPDEDTRGGFDRGGWAVPYGDEVMAQRMGESMASPGAMLFGRRTYQDLYGYWPKQTDNPFTPYLNQAIKYVVSNTLSEPLPWQNSILLSGDPARNVTDLKAEPGPDLGIVGSGQLVRSLLAAKPDRPIFAAHFPARVGSRTASFRRTWTRRRLRAGRQRDHIERRDHRELPATLTRFADAPPSPSSPIYKCRVSRLGRASALIDAGFASAGA